MKITTYRIRQFSSKPITVVCVNDIPICAARGKRTISEIVTYLNGYDVTLKDKAIQRLLDKAKEEYK